MTSSQLALKLATLIAAGLLATAALAEDMSLPGPGADCLTRATAQLSIDTATCAGRYPVSTELYGQCITNAQLAYIGAVTFCHNVSGAKLNALRGSDVLGGKTGVLKRR